MWPYLIGQPGRAYYMNFIPQKVTTFSGGYLIYPGG